MLPPRQRPPYPAYKRSHPSYRERHLARLKVVGRPPSNRTQSGGHASQVADLRFGEGGAGSFGDEDFRAGVSEDAGAGQEGE